MSKGPVMSSRAGCGDRRGASRRAASSLWTWVGAGFLFLAVLWTALFAAARLARIESVPLVTTEVRR